MKTSPPTRGALVSFLYLFLILSFKSNLDNLHFSWDFAVLAEFVGVDSDGAGVNASRNQQQKRFVDNGGRWRPIHVSIVTCSALERAREALALIRSILLFHSPIRVTSGKPAYQHQNGLRNVSLVFHLIHEKGDGIGDILNDELKIWQQQHQTKWRKLLNDSSYPGFEFFFYLASMPDQYHNLFAPCACQRLFLADLLPQDVHQVLYLDSDTLALADIADMWDFVAGPSNGHRLWKSQDWLAAMVAEHTDLHPIAYYEVQQQHPYYARNGAVGLNSGVIFLNLNFLRRLSREAPKSWNERLDEYHSRYHLQFFDQDLLNIYFYAFPSQLRILPCAWNYRSDMCYNEIYYRDHPLILHGSRGVFHRKLSESGKTAVTSFRLLYEAFVSVEGLGTLQDVLATARPMFEQLKDGFDNYCDKILPKIMISAIRQSAISAASLEESALEWGSPHAASEVRFDGETLEY
jgi:Glycosyl transferase family 8